MPKKVSDSRLGRFGKIVSLSGKVGGNLLARTASKIAGKDPGWAERKAAQQLVATLGQMKGLAQKVGQTLSMDVDHVPREVREIISALQSKSQPMDYSAIAEVIEDELGAAPEKLFASFDKEPMAAASLGQVHRAILKDGRSAAVKVQYPGAASALQADLKNIDTLLRALGGVMGPATAFKGHGYFDEVATELTRETDYLREARACRDFAQTVRGFDELRVPKVYDELCASRVLTLELLDGEPLAAILKRGTEEPNEKRFAISRGLIMALYGPMLRSGVVHADPHPGNYLVLPDGRIGVLDFGSVKHESEVLRDGHRLLYRSIIDGNVLELKPILQRLGFEVGASSAELQPVFAQFFELLRGPVKAERFDFAKTTITAEFEALGRRNFRTLMTVRPPAEALMFFRAFAGQSQNLRALGAEGPFRDAYANAYAKAVDAPEVSAA